MTLLVTGGCGFIGTNFIRDWMSEGEGGIVCLDKLTYAGRRANLDGLPEGRLELVAGDIGDRGLVDRVFAEHRPEAVLHLAAESHVDRSILGPAEFIQTNVVGTFTLLEAARAYFGGLTGGGRDRFRFVAVSTDEVYGSLGPHDPPFSESSPYSPSSPYSASKAAADHLARAYFRTYGLPVIVTSCSNNYGPWQFPEKLIPLMTTSALRGERLPVYGDGTQIRDWLMASDHARALRMVLKSGRPGETYNIGGNSERANLEVVRLICSILDEKAPRADGEPRSSLITFVKDRPGHDRRYAMNAAKIEKELGFSPRFSFEEGLALTIAWYLNNQEWTKSVSGKEHEKWMSAQYGGPK